MNKSLKLTVYRNSQLIGEHYAEQDMLKIGRLDSVHLKLNDGKVSRLHAVVEAAINREAYSVIDMGSAEGTFLNGRRIGKEKLFEGDELRLGDTLLLVSFEVRPSPGDIYSMTPELVPTGITGEAVPQDLWPVSPSEWTDEPVTGEIRVEKEPLWQVSANELDATSPTGEVIVPERLWKASSEELAAASVTGEVVLPRAAPAMQPAPMAHAPLPQNPQQAPQALSQVPTRPQQLPSRPQQAFVAGGPAVASALSQQPTVSPPAPSGTQGLSRMPSVAGGPAVAQVLRAPPPPPPASVARQRPVPNNLAGPETLDTDRALEIKAVWGDTVLDTVNVFDQPVVTMGDERRLEGWGPFQKVIRADIEIPSKGMMLKTIPLAECLGPGAANYTINIPTTFRGRIERANGTVKDLSELTRLRGSHVPGALAYELRPAETLYIEHNGITLQIRYVEKQWFAAIPLAERLNYAWLNTLVLAFFVHFMMIVSFITTPTTEYDLQEDLLKNRNRFAQFKLKPEEKRNRGPSLLLSKLKSGEPGARARGKEGKAGRKDYKGKKQGRMAIRGDPNEKELAKSALNSLFGVKGNVHRSYLFGTGGLGGELKSALGGVTGAEIGDATGVGGLGTRGTGPGGGGLSLNSVGLGALGTHGRGGGQGGYGSGIGSLGRKSDRDIKISQGSPIVMGSLDKEIIRRVIRQHIAQIRYCYEKELQRSPGIFGKVATKFVISARGTVQSADVAQTTLRNKRVEQCVTQKIRTWKFPEPKGGGIVIVKYPFIFKTAG